MPPTIIDNQPSLFLELQDLGEKPWRVSWWHLEHWEQTLAIRPHNKALAHEKLDGRSRQAQELQKQDQTGFNGIASSHIDGPSKHFKTIPTCQNLHPTNFFESQHVLTAINCFAGALAAREHGGMEPAAGCWGRNGRRVPCQVDFGICCTGDDATPTGPARPKPQIKKMFKWVW